MPNPIFRWLRRPIQLLQELLLYEKHRRNTRSRLTTNHPDIHSTSASATTSLSKMIEKPWKKSMIVPARSLSRLTTSSRHQWVKVKAQLHLCNLRHTLTEVSQMHLWRSRSLQLRAVYLRLILATSHLLAAARPSHLSRRFLLYRLSIVGPPRRHGVIDVEIYSARFTILMPF
ncbi:uncharacterized protein MYCFIDRAFT_205471, partial [Pseudocercospora fijiensis CIRAD86]